MAACVMITGEASENWPCRGPAPPPDFLAPYFWAGMWAFCISNEYLGDRDAAPLGHPSFLFWGWCWKGHDLRTSSAWLEGEPGHVPSILGLSVPSVRNAPVAGLSPCVFLSTSVEQNRSIARENIQREMGC